MGTLVEGVRVSWRVRRSFLGFLVILRSFLGHFEGSGRSRRSKSQILGAEVVLGAGEARSGQEGSKKAGNGKNKYPLSPNFGLWGFGRNLMEFLSSRKKSYFEVIFRDPVLWFWVRFWTLGNIKLRIWWLQEYFLWECNKFNHFWSLWELSFFRV